jgi:leucyl/phenylalanyl-tRNA--protein transferase
VIFDLDGTPPDIGFPDTAMAETDPNGLLAIGGDLSPVRVMQAYRRGIFPWYSAGQPILWWSPAPRMVLYPRDFHVSHSLRRSMRNRSYEVSVDQAFDAVIAACAAPRGAHDGTWLLPEMIDTYCELHRAGHAHSVEVWLGDGLAGGIYGIGIGRVFFGESMFSRHTDASKIAMARLVEIGLEEGLELIDCQIHSDHLASLGAAEIRRERFERTLAAAVTGPAPAGLVPQPRRAASTLRWTQ